MPAAAHHCATCARPLLADAAACPSCAAPAPVSGWPEDMEIGVVVAGRYRIERRVGAGGFGIVFAAEQLGQGVSLGAVALKRLRAERCSDRDAVRRFLDEARSARAIENAHAVKVFDAGVDDDGRPYMAMELLSAPTLKQVIAQEAPFPAARALSVIRQIAEAMAESHEEGIVHRDLKPSNLTLGPGDFIKILDFGIARRVFESSGLTRSAVGSPPYSAPEQNAGEAVDGRADLHALGVILVEMLIGAPPERRELPSALPAQLRPLCEELTASEPEDRPPSMRALLRRLALLEGPAPSPAVETRTRPEKSSGHGRGIWWLLPIAVAVVLLAWFALPSTPPPSEAPPPKTPARRTTMRPKPSPTAAQADASTPPLPQKRTPAPPKKAKGDPWAPVGF